MKEQPRFCLYNEFDGNFKVNLLADEFIVLGADFKIVSNDTKELLEQWKFSTENGKIVTHDIALSINDMNKTKLIWKVLCCSLNPNKFEGKVQIKLTQNNKPVKLTLPASYIVKNIPPCQLNSAEEFSGSLVFIKNTNNSSKT